MSKLIDITGNRYNHLTVVERADNVGNGIATWKCLCDCGNYTVVRGSNLKSGAVKSCGCLMHTTKPTLTHNMSHTVLYRKWASIKRRCYTPSVRDYKNYGERGIKMCDDWKNSFEAFMLWSIQSGYSDGLTIERKDMNGDYCPENCTWIPFQEQQKNRRFCRFITYKGETKTLTDWCKALNLPYKQIHNRMFKLGWSFERAVSEPVHIEKRNKKYG